jgi:glycosyltransferase involved in cell wall biosynthesis
MKIIFPFVGDSVGGSHWSVIELYNELIKADYEVLIVLHQADKKLGELLNKKNIDFIFFPIGKLAGESPNIFKIFLGIISNFYKIYSFIKKNKVQIVHGNDLRINLTWSLPVKLARKKFIWHQRTILSTSLFWRLIPLLSDHFIAISKVVMKTAPKNIHPIKKSIIINPFDTSNFYDYEISNQWLKEKYKLKLKFKLVGYVGRLQSYKNISFLIKAFNILIKLHVRDIKLLIVGDGPSLYISELKQLVERLKIEKHVVFTGFISNPMKVIAGLDVLIAPSTIDAFGRTLVEAMLQNTPTIAANHAGHSEIISKGYIDYHYDDEDIESLVRGMNLLLDKKTNEIGKRDARHHAIKLYSSNNHANKIMKTYQKVLPQ